MIGGRRRPLLYAATDWDAMMITYNATPPTAVLFIIDMPFSLVSDTILIPWDLANLPSRRLERRRHTYISYLCAKSSHFEEDVRLLDKEKNKEQMLLVQEQDPAKKAEREATIKIGRAHV